MTRIANSMLAFSAMAMVVAAPLFATIGGCSGDGQSPAGSGATCADACAKCAVADVCQDCAAWNAKMRDEVKNLLYACVIQADACSHDWEVCISSAISGAPARDLDSTYRDACMARRTECQSQGMGFADDLCLSSAAFVADLVTLAQQCITRSCNEVSACVHGVFE